MQLSGIIAAAFLAAGVAGASAEDFVKGVYLQSEELCAQAKKESLQTVIEAGNVLLTSRGLESIEYNCEFVQVNKATRSPAWAVTAICSEPGYVFPDLLSITEMSPTQFEIVSVKPVDELTGGNGGSYVFCEGVDAP